MISSDNDINPQQVLKWLEEVYDPEIPVLSVIDLGIIRDVVIKENFIEIVITPTYSGCPAMDVIAMNIRMVMMQHGYKDIQIKHQLSPAWTTDWMSEIGKQKLLSYGISPPVAKTYDLKYLNELNVICPLCHSKNARLISQFGSTSCKALYQCNDCREPFDYFKCH